MQRMVTFSASAMLLGANAALAQLPDNDRGFYIGGGYGNYSADIQNVRDVDLGFDEDDSAWRIFGGWRFNNYVAVQLDRYDFGNASSSGVSNITSDTKGWAPSIRGSLPLGPIELFARAGIVFYDVTLSLDNDLLLDDSGNDMVWSAGIGGTVLERLDLKLEYENINISDYDNADAVWVTAAWRF